MHGDSGEPGSYFSVQFVTSSFFTRIPLGKTSQGSQQVAIAN